ncbi:Hypothetical predicted protein, partial [Paramuricea clavata]
MAVKFGYSVPMAIFISAAPILVSLCLTIVVVVIFEKPDAMSVVLAVIKAGIPATITIVFPVYFVQIQTEGASRQSRFSEWNQWFFFYICSHFIVITILWRGDHDKVTLIIGLSLMPLYLILCGIDMVDHGLLPYCPAIVDIYDGIEMYYTKLNPTNPEWVQITIFLAVIMFYIPSVMEIYHLKFPELKSGSMSSERKVKLSQFVCSCIFLVVRIMLYAYKPHEIIFAAKTFIRVYCHYKAWSNMNSARQSVSIQATGISTEKALSLVIE